MPRENTAVNDSISWITEVFYGNNVPVGKTNVPQLHTHKQQIIWASRTLTLIRHGSPCTVTPPMVLTNPIGR